MELLLSVAGVVIILFSIVIGIMSRELIVFITSVVSGVFSSLLFFGLGKVISNQERIIQLHNSNLGKLNYISKNEITCSNCGKTYGEDRSSCPYCGNR